MKKIVVVNIMIGIDQGGGENFDLNLIKEAKEQGHEIELVYLHPLFSKPEKSLPEGIKLKPLRSPWLYPLSQKLYKFKFLNKVAFIRGIPRFIGQTIFELRAFFYLKSIAKEEEFVVHTCGLTILSRLTYTHLQRKCIIRLPGPVKYRFEKDNLLKSFKVIANGSAYEITNNQFHGRLPNLHYIEVGLDQDIFYPKEKKQSRLKLNFSEDLTHFLYVGRFVSIKNISMILKAMSQESLKNLPLHVHFVGKGDLKEKLVEEAKELGVFEKVTFHPPCDKTKLSEYYNASHALILTSLYENFSNAVIEAMGCGLTVVATKVGGNLKQIEHGIDGLLVENNNYKELSLVMAELVLKQKDPEQLGRKAYNRVIHSYNWKSSISCYLRLYAN